MILQEERSGALNRGKLLHFPRETHTPKIVESFLDSIVKEREKSQTEKFALSFPFSIQTVSLNISFLKKKPQIENNLTGTNIELENKNKFYLLLVTKEQIVKI